MLVDGSWSGAAVAPKGDEGDGDEEVCVKTVGDQAVVSPAEEPSVTVSGSQRVVRRRVDDDAEEEGVRGGGAVVVGASSAAAETETVASVVVVGRTAMAVVMVVVVGVSVEVIAGAWRMLGGGGVGSVWNNK